MAEEHLAVVPTGVAAFEALALAAGASPEEVADHEAAVEALLAGRTAAGADEVAILEADSGPLREVQVLGSVVDDGELRTFVELSSSTAARPAGTRSTAPAASRASTSPDRRRSSWWAAPTASASGAGRRATKL